jgi:phosphotransferase system enzyme I (PtsP)
MLPMVSSMMEIDEAMHLIHRAYLEVLEEGAHVQMPEVGLMIEVPAAVYQIRDFAQQCDFVSVGSNDLTQYLLAVDRNNARVAHLYHSLHPAVLQALAYVAAASQAEGVPIGICGELAGDPGGAVLLLAMGYNVLSMNATSLPKVKKALRNLRRSEARTLLKDVMGLDCAFDVNARLEHFLTLHGMEKFIHSPVA